jgi:hypothetical protein
MAVRSRNSFWQQIHLLTRLIGVTGLAAAPIGLFFWGLLGEVSFGPYAVGEKTLGPFTGEEIGLMVLYASAAAVGLALLFEVRGLTKAVASHRGLFGVNVLLQIALALALVIGANVYSFEHFRRFDLTRGQIFTLDEETRKQLEQLRGDTDIIVVQKHVSFGQRAENKQDKYDFAAQRKIVEKVKDLAEEFEDLGPRFHVRVLDIQEDNYDKKLDEIRKDLSEELAKAVEKAPENSVFLYSREKKRFQRISFSDIYQLDKQGSIENKNLVLKYQGVGPFAHKIFNIEEKSPRIATAIVHPLLGFHDKRMPEVTMTGSKKILDGYGFACTDITLRKINDNGGLGDPTVLNYDESIYEETEDALADIREEIEQLQKEIPEIAKVYNLWNDSSLAELNKKFAYVFLVDGRQGIVEREIAKKAKGIVKTIDVDEDDRKGRVTLYKRELDLRKHALDGDLDDEAKLNEKKSKLQVDNLGEKRRFNDLEAKAKAMLADVDLLIVPRITLIDVPQKERVSYGVHKLETAQLNAVKAFLKQGKPVLVLLGPSNEPQAGPEFDPDALEALLGELGFYLPKQVILFDAEKRAYNERKFGGFGASKREVELPGLVFDDSTSTQTWLKAREPFKTHPIRTSMRMMNRAMAASDPDAAQKEKKDTPQAEDASVVSIRHPRPVYFMRTILSPEPAASIVGALTLPGLPGSVQAATIWVNKAQKKSDDNGVFLLTRAESWNEENPFIVQNKVPRYTPTKDDDPKKGTADEERHGPFPIGVAVEAQIPASWMDKDAAKAPNVRVAVIGSGGAFVGPTLPPLKEKLFLDTVNWLLGRDDLLARDAETWEYPRVELSPLELKCWYAVSYGLPVLFIYMGMVVWLVRRMR